MNVVYHYVGRCFLRNQDYATKEAVVLCKGCANRLKVCGLTIFVTHRSIYGAFFGYSMVDTRKYSERNELCN